MTREGMGTYIAVMEGASTKSLFEAYVGRHWPRRLDRDRCGGDGEPFLAQGSEDARAHRGTGLRAVLYLAPYSPDLNPIERVFAKLKALLSRAQARTFGTPIEAMGRALGEITDRDASDFFGHWAYHAPAQLP
jgi:hypothetical protein